MNFFFVASRGLTASTWFCQALAAHPQLYCSHGRDKPERSLKVRELIDDKAYRKKRLEYELWQKEATLTQFMKELEVSPTTEPCKGNIHGYILPELLQKLKGENLLNKIPIANMTRDPIGFIESYSCLVIQNAIEYPEKYYLEHLPRAKSNMHLLKIFSKTPESDYEMQGFIEACFMLKKMASDLEYKEIPVIQMEKITTDKAYFKDIFTFLTRGSLELDESRLDKIFEGGRINSHTKIVKKSCKDSRPPNIWMNWSECKKKAFLEIIDPQILRRHISLGYDLSYLIDAKNNL